MSVPAFIIGAGALFWGWQTSHPFVGALLALVLEAPRFTRFRLQFSETDYRRISDFSSALFAGMAVLMLVNQGTTRGVLSSLQWFPVVLAPLLLTQRLGESGLIRTSALFHYLRRQLRRDPALRDPLVDLAGPYLALLIVAAGAANARGAGYFAGVVLLSAWGLYALRPRHAPKALFATLLVVATGAGWAGGVGLSRLQAAIEAWVDDFLVFLPNDPERSVTRIGSIGRLKQHDSIALRLYAPQSQGERLHLLHTASFNEYKNGVWVAREPAVPVDTGGTPSATAAIVLRVSGGRALLPVPSGTIDIVGVPTPPQRNPLGAIVTHTPSGWLRYEAGYADTDAGYAPPTPADLVIPAAERATLERLASEWDLRRDPVTALQRRFQNFSYSTWLDDAPPSSMTALENFLLRSKSGHCEYYAAATTLLLRAAGVPARYATGFAVMEYSNLEGAWLVRARHAHAWSRAYIKGHWVDVDLTPPDWLEAESSFAPPWERILDLLRWATFRWSTRTEEDASTLWWAAAAILTIILAWRIVTQRRAVRIGESAVAVNRTWPGADSELYQLEKKWALRFGPRAPGQPLSVWISEIEKHLSDAERRNASALIEIHYRYRFDPAGITPEERRRLRETATSAA